MMLPRKSKLRFTIYLSCVISILLIILSFSFTDSAATYLSESFDDLPPQTYSFLPTLPRQKVFVIGLSKTGTTSLGDALARLSYSRLGWEDIRSRYLFRSYLRGHIAPFISISQQYDAFEDLPWALVYQDMAQLYPDAKFILTLREKEEDWVTSIKGHTERRKWIGHNFVYGAQKAQGNEELYLDAYRNHTASVRQFFGEVAEQERLLEWVIDGEKMNETPDMSKWEVLLRFLGMDDDEQVRRELGIFPWTNKTRSWKEKKLLKGVWWMWDAFMFRFEAVSLSILESLGWLTGGMG